MNWISEEDKKKGWKKFFESCFYPIQVWFLNLIFICGLSYVIVAYPENLNININNYLEIAKNIMLIVTFLFNFNTSIITAFATLILTLFLNLRNENENNWTSPDDYARKSAYKKYVWTITHVLGSVWFISFICGLLNIEDDRSRINSDIPVWVFLFLSWFILSISRHVNSIDLTTHDKIMKSCYDIRKIEDGNNGLNKISAWIYELHVQKEKNRKPCNYTHYKLRNEIPGRIESAGLISLVGGGKNKIKGMYKYIAFTILFGTLFQSFILVLFYWATYEIKLKFDLKLIIGALTTIFVMGILISIYYLLNFDKNIVNWRITSRAYKPRYSFFSEYFFEYLFSAFSFYILLAILHVIVLAALTGFFGFGQSNLPSHVIFMNMSFTSPTHINLSIYNYFSILVICVFSLFVLPVLEIFIYQNILDKRIENINNEAMNILIPYYFESLKSSGIYIDQELRFSNDEEVNIYKIAMSVYLRLESRQLYMTYRLSSGKDTKNIDQDLEDAYETAKRDIK